jgi:hypothetical protein
MSAAVPHDQRDRGGVAVGIETGHDRVRGRGHLTERQKGRQNLDKKHIHEDGCSFSHLGLGIPRTAFLGLSGRPGKPAAAEEAYHMDQKVPLTRDATNTATSYFLTLCCMAATPAA